MMENFKQIKFLYDKANVYVPKSVFRQLSQTIKAKNGDVNIKQTSFAYAYLVGIAFLYKYTMYIDIDNHTYVQNTDIKKLLGYSASTKSIDKVIKKDGILDSLNLTRTIRNYPVYCEINHEEDINGISIREYTTIDELEDKSLYKSIVKNRNYTVKEPVFLTDTYDDNEYGTLYSVKDTHPITISEYLHFVSNDNLDNVDFMIYGYLKSKCKGRKNDEAELSLSKILRELGLCGETFLAHLEKLKINGFINVVHRKWYKLDENSNIKVKPNKYKFIGIDKK